MALFGWKKKDDGSSDNGKGSGGGGEGGGGGGAGYEFDPGKAGKFFERAQTLHDATNHAYAMNLWLRGLRQDPTSMHGLEGFFRSAGAFFSDNPKGEKDDMFKSTAKDVSGRSGLEKYLLSLLQWSAHPLDAAYAVRAMENGAGLGLADPAVWIADRAFGAAGKEKKPKKDQFVSIMKVYHRFEKFDRAVAAGEAAMRADPTDGKLGAEVRNMSAESTMTKGGFDQTGEAGGFRSNIRDAEKQRRLEDQERVGSTEESLDRLVAGARADAETSPSDRPIAIKFIDLLLKRGRPEDEEEAHAVAARWYEKAQEYRFRETMDGIRVRQLRRKAVRMNAAAQQPGASEEARQASKAATAEYVKAEIVSLEGQVAAYPTDLNRKFELAQKYFHVRKFEEAIALLQEAKGDVKNRARVYFFLGLSFQKIGWHDEAIETLRQANAMKTDGDEKTAMELKYGLMEALLARATEQSTMADAEEAYKLASEIAIQNISYREIRAKRDEIKALIAKLKGTQV